MIADKLTDNVPIAATRDMWDRCFIEVLDYLKNILHGKEMIGNQNELLKYKWYRNVQVLF